MRQNNYKRLGQYIEPVVGRNNGAHVTNLMGISYNKVFIPSIANIIGTDLSTYRIIKPGDFAFCPVTSRNGDRITIARYRGDEDCIISQAYLPFRVKDENKLDPEYLMMWVMRSEFDRYARFQSHGSVREIFSWDDMCDVLLPIPDIDVQRNIVAEYQAIDNRIRNNDKLIAKLEKLGQVLFHDRFVSGIDYENLPDGWKLETVKSFCKKITSGGTPLRTENSYWNHKDYRWLKTGEIKNNVIIDTEEYISEDGLQNSSAKIIPAGSISFAMYCADGVTGGQVAYLDCDTSTNQACCNMICKCKEDSAYLFFYFINRQIELKRIANGAAQANLSLTIVGAQPIIYFEDKSIVKELVQILDYIVKVSHENFNLRKIKHLLLTKLA